MKSVTIETSGCTKHFKCPMCDEICDTKAEARKHCTEDIDCIWICDDCGEEYDTKRSADGCCKEYICDDCGEGYELYSDAQNCKCELLKD